MTMTNEVRLRSLERQLEVQRRMLIGALSIVGIAALAAFTQSAPPAS